MKEQREKEVEVVTGYQGEKKSNLAKMKEVFGRIVGTADPVVM